MSRQHLKGIAIATGLYRPARLLERALIPSKCRDLQSGIDFYRQFIGQDDLCFDIGANRGNKTEMMLMLGATVVSVEPQPDLVREIRARTAPYAHKSIVVQSATGEREGVAKLNLRAESAFATLLDDWVGQATGTLEVPITTLDTLVKKNGIPRFIKLDVEGYESETLRGLSYPVPFLSLEYHCTNDGIARAHTCIELLSRSGPVEINATLEEDYFFLLESWMSGADFRGNFPACLEQRLWGDLIVRRAI